MLDTFNPDNEMLLAAVQELTAELATAQGKIAELEKGGGGGGTFVITQRQEGQTYILDKTYAEIVEAIQNNKIIIYRVPYEEDFFTNINYPSISYFEDTSTIYFTIAFEIDEGNVYSTSIEITSESVTVTQNSLN